MWRWMVLTLIFINVGYFSWGQGWLLPYGLGPTLLREPQRLQQQIQPQSITLVSDQEAAKLLAPPIPDAPLVLTEPVCLQSAWLDAPRAATVRHALEQTLPEGGWTLTPDNLSERWIIYLGRYANAADVTKKRAQLARIEVKSEVLNNGLSPGLSLGAYPSQALANAALEAFIHRGVRTARVVMERASEPGYRVHLKSSTEATPTQLNPIKAILPGKMLMPCPQPVSE